MKLIFATNNEHKLEEIRAIINPSFEISGLREMGIYEDIPETASTLEGNATQKANYIFNKLGMPCFADDTGLEVEALDHRPGVFSSRYAGPEGIAENNINKLLKELSGVTNRKARFRTIIAFVHQSRVYHFEGIVHGIITEEKRGNRGFGYDPVFLPRDSDNTFAQMLLTEKNKISHRSLALQKFIHFLNSYQLNP